MEKYPQKNFRIDKPLARELRLHCKMVGARSESAVIKTALREYLEKQKQKEEAQSEK